MIQTTDDILVSDISHISKNVNDRLRKTRLLASIYDEPARSNGLFLKRFLEDHSQIIDIYSIVAI